MIKIFKHICVIILLGSANFSILPRFVSFGFNIGKFGYYAFLMEQFTSLSSYSYSTDINNGLLPKPMMPKHSGLQYEFNISVNYEHLMLDFDLGFGSTNWHGEYRIDRYNLVDRDNIVESDYKSRGAYIKYGLMYNFLIKTDSNNAAYLGLKHAISIFNDDLDSYLTHVLVGGDELVKAVNPMYKKGTNAQYLKISYSQKFVVSNWFELVGGVRVNLYKSIFLGSSLRYKFWLTTSNNIYFDSFDILGWGLNNDAADKTCIGYDLTISFGVPLEKSDKRHKRKDYRSSVSGITETLQDKSKTSHESNKQNI